MQKIIGQARTCDQCLVALLDAICRGCHLNCGKKFLCQEKFQSVLSVTSNRGHSHRSSKRGLLSEEANKIISVSSSSRLHHKDYDPRLQNRLLWQKSNSPKSAESSVVLQGDNMFASKSILTWVRARDFGIYPKYITLPPLALSCLVPSFIQNI